jgi:protein involved in polysaccharide export with SLBB domain
MGVAFASIGVLLLVPFAQAQSEFNRVDQTRSNAGTYVFFTQPGAATLQVQVLGTVRTPGLYEVSEGTTMGQLMALSGGPPLNVRSGKTKVTTTVRLYRPNPAGSALLYEGLLEDGISDPARYPTLQDDDVIMVDVTQRQPFGWRDAARVIGAVGVVVLTAGRVARIGV